MYFQIIEKDRRKKKKVADPTGPTSRPNGPARPPPPRPPPLSSSFPPGPSQARPASAPTGPAAGRHRPQPLQALHDLLPGRARSLQPPMPATSPTSPPRLSSPPEPSPIKTARSSSFPLSPAPDPAPRLPNCSLELAGVAPPPSARHGHLGPNHAVPRLPTALPPRGAPRPRFFPSRGPPERRRRARLSRRRRTHHRRRHVTATPLPRQPPPRRHVSSLFLFF
jgi:hypothetical protein